jgi:long-chain fatty acid transport protein
MKKTSLALIISAVCYSQLAHAEGYKLFEQSVSAMGNAYAGRGAQITDATLVHSNPAAISRLDGTQIATGLNLIHAETRYNQVSAKSANGASVIGRVDGKNSLNEAVPFVFYSTTLDDKFSIGTGFYVPFGLSSDYQDDWAGRYFADETAIEVLAVTAVAAYQVSAQWSIGLGINLNHAEGTLSKFKDHSGLCELGTGINQLYKADVYNSLLCQSHYSVTGDDLAFGYSLGLHGQVTPELRLAMVYHSAVKFNLQGDSVITNTPITGAQVAGNSNFIVVSPTMPVISKQSGKLAINPRVTEASRLALTTPASLALSLDHQLSSAWSWQASLSWTLWSDFRSIDIVSTADSPSISLSTQLPQNLNGAGYIGFIPEHWRDSLSVALGLSWQLQPDRMLKTGLAYDENPIEQSHRTARVPTNDRVWWTLGMNQQLNAQWSLDLAAGWMWMDALNIREREYNVQEVALYKSGLTAHYRNDAWLLGAQLNYRF